MNIFLKILYIIFFIILSVAFIKFALLFLLVALLLLWLRTWQMKHEPNQQDFLQGKIPNPKLDGIYYGNMGFDTSWIGKKIDAEQNTGINLFKNKKGVQTSKYPFKTSVSSGLFDENLLVLKISYNVKGNPFWVRWIEDEIVEIKPSEYLGKMNLKIIPGLPFSVLYFDLKK